MDKLLTAFAPNAEVWGIPRFVESSSYEHERVAYFAMVEREAPPHARAINAFNAAGMEMNIVYHPQRCCREADPGDLWCGVNHRWDDPDDEVQP